MRMFRTRVDLELAVHRISELGFRQHAAYGILDQLLGSALPDQPRAFLPKPALVTAVLPIDLLVFFTTRQFHLGRVDNDDVITRVDERRIYRLVLSLKQARRRGGNPTEHPSLRVDEVPSGQLSRIRT